MMTKEIHSRPDQNIMIKWDREGNLIAGGISGRDFIAQNMRWHLGTRTPESTKLLKDYQEYLTGVENLHKWQKEHETYLGDLEGQYKDYQDHLTNVQGQQKEYQDYLSDLQTEQSDLTSCDCFADRVVEIRYALRLRVQQRSNNKTQKKT